MARRMKQQKEYYWQGKGGPDVTLEKIIFELLGRDFEDATEYPAYGEMTDVYTLQFDSYDEDSGTEGHSIIHVSHNERSRIVFHMILLSDTSTMINGTTTMINSVVKSVESLGFAVYLRKIASNQPHRIDFI